MANKAIIGDDATPGPGYYQAEKVEVFPIYKYKQSSMFASKVDRISKKNRNSMNGLGQALTTSGSKVRARTNLTSKGIIRSLNPISPTNGATDTTN
jgi:hypothetical protein